MLSATSGMLPAALPLGISKYAQMVHTASCAYATYDDPMSFQIIEMLHSAELQLQRVCYKILALDVTKELHLHTFAHSQKSSSSRASREAPRTRASV
eukprot:1022472-Amphidinium_carterae.2